MKELHIHEYERPSEGVRGYAGTVEPAGRMPGWILFVRPDGSADLWPQREADGGVVGEPIRLTATAQAPAALPPPPAIDERAPATPFRAPIHPGTAAVLAHFRYAHLPPTLRSVSRRFAELAVHLVMMLPAAGPELTASLRRLLEAKDCAVRAALNVDVTAAALEVMADAGEGIPF